MIGRTTPTERRRRSEGAEIKSFVPGQGSRPSVRECLGDAIDLGLGRYGVDGHANRVGMGK